MAQKKKPPSKPRKSASSGAKPSSSSAKPKAPRKQASRASGPKPLPPPTTTLQQELRMMAHSGAQSLQSLIVFLAVLVVIAGIGIGAWAMRPVPSYASEEQKAGSPFDATFTAENTNPWFAMKGLKFACVLDHVRASGREPTLIEATDVRFPVGSASELKPGEQATFRCPFRALFGLPPLNEDYGVVHRSQIYFRATYDLPFIGTIRLSENSVPFVLNTRLLPPRWTSKPEG
jgi:hypothetical protein